MAQKTSPEHSATSPRADFPVSIEMASSMARTDVFPTTQVEGFLRELMGDLGVAGSPTVHIASGDDSRLDRVPFLIRMDNHVCLPALPSTITAEDSDDDICRAMMWTIYDHRRTWAVDAHVGTQRARRYLETVVACNHALPAGDRIDLESSERLLAERGASLTLMLGNALYDSMTEQDEDPLADQLDRMRDDLFYESGIIFPLMDLERDPSLNSDEFRLVINDVRCPPEECVPDGYLAVNATEPLLTQTGLPGTQLETRAAHWEFSSTPDSEAGLARNTLGDAGLTFWSRAEYIVLCVAAEIRRHFGAFINQDVVEHLLSRVRQTWPRLMTSVDERWDVTWLTRMLRSLAEEGVSLYNLRAVLEQVLSFDGEYRVSTEAYVVLLPAAGGPCPVPAGLDGPDAYANALRSLLRHQVSGPSVEGGTLWYFDVGPDVEARARRSRSGRMRPDDRADIVLSVLSALGEWGTPSGKWVLMTAFDTRAKLRQALAPEFPWLKVLCRQEVAPDYTPTYLGTVRLGDSS